MRRETNKVFAKQNFASMRERARKKERGMVQGRRLTPQDMAERALDNARAAVAKGNRASADHWIKTADNLARVAERVAAEKANAPPTEDVEAIRAELRARVARFCGAAQDLNEWQKEKDIRDAVAAFAREHNLPEPPPVGPPPFTEEEMELTGAGKYYPFSRETPLVPEGTRRYLGMPIED
jgi:hypothetical protein